MKNDRFKAKTDHAVAAESQTTNPAEGSVAISQPARRGWSAFWFAPIDPVGLHCLRFCCGLLFILWLLPFVGHQMEFYGLAGWADVDTFEALKNTPDGGQIPKNWSLVYLCGEDPALLQVVWWGTLAVFLMFALGMATRITCVLTWLGVVSFAANPAIIFEGDLLLIILAFYLMVGYLLIGQWNGSSSWQSRVVCNTGTCFSPLNSATILPSQIVPSHAANLAIRLIQVHFAILFVTSGLVKLQFHDWWGGVALWFPLHAPFSMNLERLRALADERESIMFLVSLGCYLTMAWLIAFPFFAWRPRWRWLVVGGGVVAWIGCVFIYDEPLFGPVYFLGCLSFLSPEQWRGIIRPLAGLLGRGERQESGRVQADVRPEYSR